MSEKARILLIGSGGVGTMAAYALESGGRASVTAVCRSNYSVASTRGFAISSLDHGEDIQNFKPSQILSSVPDVSSSGSHPPFDYLVVTTKNIPDIKPTVVDIIAPAVTPGVTTIVLLQNGLNIESPLIASFPTNAILSGISLIGATETSPGVIRHDDSDRARLGPFPGQAIATSVLSERTSHFLALYMACGKVHWEIDGDVSLSRWRKLVYNASFNPVSAILNGLDTARMRMSETVIDDLIRPAMLEIKATAVAMGHALPEGLEEDLIRVDPTDTAFVPSMGQDAVKGNYIEVENLVGEPVREAERLGVPVPTLRTIYGLLKAVQLRTKEARGLWRPVFEASNPYA